MKKYCREPEPFCLVENSKKWNEIWIKKVEQSIEDRKRAIWTWNKYEKQSVNKLLELDLLTGSGHKCAFCSTKLAKSHSQILEIEHFRPKVEFPKFAFTWSNLYPICHCCNMIKKDNFSKGLIPPDHQEFEEDWLEFSSEGKLTVSNKCPKKYEIGLSETINYYQLEVKDWYVKTVIPKNYDYEN